MYSQQLQQWHRQLSSDDTVHPTCATPRMISPVLRMLTRLPIAIKQLVECRIVTGASQLTVKAGRRRSWLPVLEVMMVMQAAMAASSIRVPMPARLLWACYGIEGWFLKGGIISMETT